jgi:hypothetical protein
MALTPASLYLRLYRGADFAAVITCQDSAGNAVDLTGYTIVAQARRTPSGTLVKDLAPVISDAAAGEITSTLTAADTLAIPAGEYVWDMFVEDNAGFRSGPYVAGKFIVSEPVSKFS